MKTPARFALVALLLLAGCQKADPMKIRISAASADTFGAWRIRVGSDLTADEWRAFDDAMSEIKLQVMAAREATGAAAIDDAARTKIEGTTVRDVLQNGWEAKLRRLNVERSQLLTAVEQNSRLTTKPGDSESANYLDRIRQRQNEHLERLAQDIAATEQKLKSLPKAAPAGTS